MATHSSVLAWRMPWTEEPVGSVGLQRVKESHTAEVTGRTHSKTGPLPVTS